VQRSDLQITSEHFGATAKNVAKYSHVATTAALIAVLVLWSCASEIACEVSSRWEFRKLDMVRRFVQVCDCLQRPIRQSMMNYPSSFISSSLCHHHHHHHHFIIIIIIIMS